MIYHQQQPWQPGYRNPADSGVERQIDRVPDALQDDFARNTHDLANDIVTVVQTDFASGNGIQGGFRIAGDVVEGVANSTGDTLRQGADSLAQRIDDRHDGLASDIVVKLVSGAGNLAERVADTAGNVAEKAADVVGGGLQALRNLFR